MPIRKDVSRRWELLTVIIIIVIGVALRTYQLIMGRSLWEDECHLALNLINRNFLQLIEPLDYLQSAPIGFLLATKAIMTIAGDGEVSLRFFVYLLSCLSLIVIWVFLRRIEITAIARTASLFLIATNLALIYFAAELKPYGIDVLTHHLLMTLSFMPASYSRSKCVSLFTCVSILAIALSNVAVVSIITVGIKWAVDSLTTRRRIESKYYYSILAALGIFGLYYIIFVRGHPYRDAFRNEWQFAFPPNDITSCEFLTFAKRTFQETVFDRMVYFPQFMAAAFLFLLIFFAGVIKLWRSRSFGVLMLLLAPTLVHLAMSFLQMYPFWYRFLLYLLPSWIILLCIGIHSIILTIGMKRSAIVSVIMGAVALCLSYRSLSAFPLWFREIRPAIKEINRSQGLGLYILDPINTYRYYLHRRIAKQETYVALLWTMNMEQFNELTANETRPFLLLYGNLNSLGFGEVLAELSKSGRILMTDIYHGYNLSRIAPNAAKNVEAVVNLLPSEQVIIDRHSVFPIWNNEPFVRTVQLAPGEYLIELSSRGASAKGKFPIIEVSVDGISLEKFEATTEFTTRIFKLKVLRAQTNEITLRMLNDTVAANEDRNFFISGFRVTVPK